MTEFKNTISRVAFGGDWVESILSDHERDQLRAALAHIEETCADIDHRHTPEFEQLCSVINVSLEKGPALSKALRKALTIEHQDRRIDEVKRCCLNITRWI